MSFRNFISTKLFWRHLGLASAVVLVFLWGLFKILDQYTLHNEHVEVPNFQGVYIKDLEKFVSGNELSFEIVDSIYTAKSQKGTVVDQDPAPGSTVKKGRTVYLTVYAMKNQQVSMPNLIDLSLRQATSLLETYGLEVGHVRYTEGLPPVIQQLYKGRPIKPGEFIDKGSSVDLVVGGGNSHGLIDVPDLFGMTIQEARQLLSDKKLVLGNCLPDATATDSLSSKIFQQNPPAGSKEGLYAGATIDVSLTGSDDVLESYREKTEVPE
jgi:beta-lactam-binding protein with PASTA domain